MIKSLTEIRGISVIDQNQLKNLYSLSEINFEEKEVGSGGFGSVHKVYSIDGINKDCYVIKIFTNEEKKEHAYEVIKLLHDKIKSRQNVTGLPIFHEFPELLGLPFFAFKGYDKISEKECIGFLMYDLSSLGYEFFGNDDIKKSEYQNLEITDKVYLAYKLAKVIDFLHQIEFIHSDINEQSIFINPERIQLAIIDFDSGYHFDKQDKPSTLGKMSHWLSGKFRKLIGENNSENLTLEDRIREENWLLANGLFEVIFGLIPYFFLNDADDYTKKEYLKNNTWPLTSNHGTFINNSTLPTLQNLQEILENFKNGGASDLIKSFEVVFNEGYDKEKKRLNSKEWKAILYQINFNLESTPNLLSFNSDKKIISRKNEAVKFQWNTKRYNTILLDGNLCDIHGNTKVLNISDLREIKLTVKNDFGEINETIKIEANKIAPEILSFESSVKTRKDLTPVELSWKTKNTSKVLISNIQDSQKSNGKLEVDPKQKTIYILKAIGHFDQEIEKQIQVDVIQPQILEFKYEINLNKGIDNIDLSWRTENAIEAEITPKIGKVITTGTSHVKIRKEATFTLTVVGHFGRVQKTIDTFPFPAPIIEHLLVETPKIEMQSDIIRDFVNYPFENLKLTNIEYTNIIQIEKKNLNEKILNKQLVPPDFELENKLLDKTFKEEISLSEIYQKIKEKIYSKLNENH
ncbi:serine/threonine-protein kinase [uncultured Salegentibacter sp.]|uniref:serine/threonine-protein kinase n=1 Tax=uncultured Salegentibacter sp. TaxID=259320 RepID=UPI00259798FF|nr:serine/threonine-protein kinase [uncultured Salegentibacter sp.]